VDDIESRVVNLEDIVKELDEWTGELGIYYFQILVRSTLIYLRNKNTTIDDWKPDSLAKGISNRAQDGKGKERTP